MNFSVQRSAHAQATRKRRKQVPLGAKLPETFLSHLRPDPDASLAFPLLVLECDVKPAQTYPLPMKTSQTSGFCRNFIELHWRSWAWSRSFDAAVVRISELRRTSVARPSQTINDWCKLLEQRLWLRWKLDKRQRQCFPHRQWHHRGPSWRWQIIFPKLHTETERYNNKTCQLSLEHCNSTLYEVISGCSAADLDTATIENAVMNCVFDIRVSLLLPVTCEL